MDSRTQRASGTDPHVDPRIALATWLRSGRLHRKLSLQDVAKVTKIQPRILEKLESGQLDGLPADVFVKGFVRSFAKCVGLPESEAIERYGAAQSGQATAIAKALVETMSPTVRLVEPRTLTIEPEPSVDVIEVAPAVVEPAPAMQIVEVVTVAELARIAVATPAAAPVEAGSTEDSAPIAGSPVVEIAAALSASLETGAPATPKKKRASRKKSTTSAPKVTAGEATEAAPALVAEAVVAASSPAAATAAPAPKAPRSRKKKTTVTPVVSAAVVEIATAAASSTAATFTDASIASTTDAQASVLNAPEALTNIAIERNDSLDMAAESLPETTPFIRIDATSAGALSSVSGSTELAELHEAASFAMSLTSEYELELSIDEADSSDGFAELQLAEGSQRISSSAIASLGSAEVRSGAEGWRGDTIEFEDRTSGTWQPTMPALSSTPSAPWRRPQLPTQNAYVVPSLVIDDADPDSADREREVRASSKDHSRLSFLPPILRDREDRSARQGGLTLAVIILLIAATLTLSYLMRRPSPSGDGVTLLDGQTQLYS